MQNKNTIPTNQGDMTIPVIMDSLMWGSYKFNRDEGLTHEQLGRLGIGNDAMRERYELLQQSKNN